MLLPTAAATVSILFHPPTLLELRVSARFNNPRTSISWCFDWFDVLTVAGACVDLILDPIAFLSVLMLSVTQYWDWCCLLYGTGAFPCLPRLLLGPLFLINQFAAKWRTLLHGKAGFLLHNRWAGFVVVFNSLQGGMYVHCRSTYQFDWLVA